MSYALSAALQEGIYDVLSADSNLAALVGPNIFDAAPNGAVPDLFVSLGIESADIRHDTSGVVATFRCTVSVVAQDQGGFLRAKAAAGAVTDALDGALPVLARGRVSALNLRRAVARRLSGGARRQIDLRFVARVDDC